jgi:glycosyltransferase involved in cell wall biosynthesis
VQPLVSIAVIGDRDWRNINRSLESLRRLELDDAPEILVLHDPAIAREMQMHEGVQLIPILRGTPFTHALQAAVSQARGSYLYVVDSRLVPAPGAVAALARTLMSDSGIALVGSRICRLDGNLYEAGRVILSDGTIQPCGAGFSISDSRYAFVRDVDSVSPSSFMVRLDWLRIASLDGATFAAAAYAVADLCLETRVRGVHCVCQPLSVVFSEENLDSAADSGDARAFTEKWLGDGGPTVRSARSSAIMFLDEHVPFDDRDAGSRRVALLLRLARAHGWSVVFGSLDDREYTPYCDRLRQAGIEVILGFGEDSLIRLRARGSLFDCVWMSRARVASKYLAAVRSSQPQARVVYDTVDLHFVRLSRQAMVQGRGTGHDDMERLELDAARRSDVTVVTSSHEVETLHTRGIMDIAIVSLGETRADHVPDRENRQGILFLGNYAHAPNVDAALWLAEEIMPCVRRRVPGIVLTLAGADPTPAIRKLSSRLVHVPGFIDDLEPVFARHRVFGAPLRFGAGLKGKIVQAMAAGVPIVTTSIGAEGITGSENELVIADDVPSFADALVRLHENKQLWDLYSGRVRRGALRFSPETVAAQFYAVLERQ